MSTETIERAYAASQPARLRLSNIRGDIRIQGGGEEIRITATKRLDSGHAEATTIDIHQEADGTVVAETHYHASQFSFLHIGLTWPCLVEYTVSLPQHCDLIVDGVSSNVLVENLEGNLRAKSVSGEVVARSSSGRLDLNSVSGRVYGEGLSGSGRFESVSGEVRLAASHLSALNASSISGRVSVETALGEGPYSLESKSGSLELSVPAESNCELSFDSISGHFHTDLPASSQQFSGRACRMRLGNGHAAGGSAPKVRMNTISGSGRLLASQAAYVPVAYPPSPAAAAAYPAPAAAYPVQEPLPPVPPPSPYYEAPPMEDEAESPNPRDILDRLDRGEISVEDALKELGS